REARSLRRSNPRPPRDPPGGAAFALSRATRGAPDPPVWRRSRRKGTRGSTRRGSSARNRQPAAQRTAPFESKNARSSDTPARELVLAQIVGPRIGDPVHAIGRAPLRRNAVGKK